MFFRLGCLELLYSQLREQNRDSVVDCGSMYCWMLAGYDYSVSFGPRLSESQSLSDLSLFRTFGPPSLSDCVESRDDLIVSSTSRPFRRGSSSLLCTILGYTCVQCHFED